MPKDKWNMEPVMWQSVKTAKKINHYYADGESWSAEIWSPGNFKRTGKQKIKTPTCPAWNYAVFDNKDNIIGAGELLRTFQEAERIVRFILNNIENSA